MRKKSLVAIAVLATLTMSIGMFAGCAPTSPDKYLEAMKTATVGSTEITMGELSASISNNDDEFSMIIKQAKAKEGLASYVVKEGKKLVLYTNADGKWRRTEDSKEIEKAKPKQNNAEIVKGFSTKKEEYDIADGVWTHKILKYTLKVEAGKLVIEESKTELKIVFNAKKPNISVPKEAKDEAKK